MFTDFDIVKCSKRFRELRTDEGMSHETLAKRLGVSPQLLKNYEQAYLHNGVATGAKTDKTNAIAGMKIETLYKIADFFNVSADYLLGLSDSKSPDAEHRTASNHFGLDDVAAARLHEIKGTEEGEALKKLLAVDTFVSEYLADIAEAIALKKNLPADAKEQPKEYAAMQAVFGAIAKKTARLPDSNGQIKLSELETINYFIQCAANASQEIVKHIIDREGANNGEQ